MTFLQWRRFNFFEKKFLTETVDHPLTELAKSCQITCSSSGNGSLIFGDISGLIYLIGRQHTISSFSAYKVAVTHCCTINNRYSAPNSASNSSQSNSKFYIVTVGTDTENLIPILKIWSINEAAINSSKNTADNTNSSVFPSTSDTNSINVSSISEQNSTPIQTCIRSIKLCQNTSNLANLKVHASVTVLDVLDDTLIAVGFNDGNCLVIKGDLTRDKNIRMQLLEVSSDDSSITGLSFSSYTKTSNQQLNKSFRAFSSAVPNTKQHIILFVSTRNEICSFDLSSRNKEAKLVLDSFGCDISCSCLKRDPKQLESIQYIVGRNDAIYFYNIDGRGPCLAFDGKKLFLYWFRNYLVAITLNDINRATTNQTTATNVNANSESPSSHSTTLLTNPNTNLITIYDIARKFIAYSCPIPSVNQVVSEWGNLYIITTDGRICLFTECDTQTKLELLFRKNQFSLAIDLAKSQTYSQDYLADMFKQYGDHLYRTGDYDGAINQYCQTIGVLEPSYVIRKFLDLQRIYNLTLYLQELHKRGLAIEDHTTLLINCYVKLKDEQKLNEFLRSSDIVFDVDIAIRVLRQAGFYDNAILLAKRHGLFDSYFSILLEDKSDSKIVLETFQELLKDSKHEIVSQYLSKYGRLLMADEPDKTTDLLKSLCSHIFRQPRENTTTASNLNTNKSSEYLFDLNDLASSLNGDSLNSEFKPEKFLHIFLNHSSKLIEFLEFLINESKSDRNPYELSFEISNTLLEIYLHSYKNEIKEDGLAENETKIMNFLKNENLNYDFKKAMILCQMSNFMPGVLYLYEKTRMFKQILANSISQNDSQSVIQICKKYGEEEPNLWVDALWYFSEIYNDNYQADTLLVLEHIEKHQLLPPLMVVEILSKYGKVTLGAVRDYLMRWIEAEQRQIDDNEKLIESYREECETIRLQIKDIKSKPRIFQSSKCAACSHALELPTVHFLCGHSYHHHCFESYVAENDRDCPLCLPENRKILNEISLLDNVNNVNDLFQQELLDTSDPFDVIARYCSQGLFNPLTVVTDDGLIQSHSQANKNLL